MSDAMICIEIRTATKRNYSQISQLSVGLVPASDHIPPSKRSKLNSNISIDDLHDTILAEILCRLPCKFVFQCKRVSKRWCTLISDPSFIDQFLCFQQERKTPTFRTLLNREATEFLITMSDEAREQSENVTFSTPLSSLFKEIMTCYSLKREPAVVATCNDLVLCQYQEHDYYICNPYTSQWFALPTPQADEFVKVGFLCDFDSGAYRCKVVGITEETKQEDLSGLKVEIFSSNTGEWKESIVSFTQEIDIDDINGIAYAYNGMLYWMTADDFAFGFDPFMISTSTNDADTTDHYKGRIIKFKDASNNDETSCRIDCVGVCGGRLRFIREFDTVSYAIPVWDLQEEQEKRDVDRSGNVFLKCRRYIVDREMCLLAKRRYLRRYPIWRVFDPNDEDILFVRPKRGFAYECNIRTGESSRLPDDIWWNVRDFLYPLIPQPWWPTPVPSKNTTARTSLHASCKWPEID